MLTGVGAGNGKCMPCLPDTIKMATHHCCLSFLSNHHFGIWMLIVGDFVVTSRADVSKMQVLARFKQTFAGATIAMRYMHEHLLSSMCPWVFANDTCGPCQGSPASKAQWSNSRFHQCAKITIPASDYWISAVLTTEHKAKSIEQSAKDFWRSRSNWSSGFVPEEFLPRSAPVSLCCPTLPCPTVLEAWPHA